jgi:hypothetical protein
MGELVLFLIVGGGIWLAIAVGQSAGKRQQARRQVALARWQHAVNTCSTYRQFRLAHVTRVTQRYPRRGTKAWITWHASNEQQDAWVEKSFRLPADGSS